MKFHALLFGTALLAGTGACAVDRGADSTASWSLDTETPDGALLGVWGSGPDDVWAVGGQADSSLVMHSDGARWTRVPVTGSSLLYTVYGFTANDAYAVGDDGLILHFDGTDWKSIASGTELPLYGVWGSSGDDVWIVGGQIGGSKGSAVLLRGSRGSFQRVTDIPAELVPDVMFKVHGFAPDDVLVVGSDGVLRWNGTEWRRDQVPVDGPLFSTWGRGADDLYAVGGQATGEILHFDGTGWSEVAQLPIGRGLSGVFSATDGMTFAVGAYALVFELGLDGALKQAALPALPMSAHFHAVWGDSAGTTYTVGGDLAAYTGVIVSRR